MQSFDNPLGPGNLGRPSRASRISRGAPRRVTDDPIKVDGLRERLAAPELADARKALERGGITAVIAMARAHLASSEDARARFEILSRDVETKPAERDALIEEYLRETVTDARDLKMDLRARKKSKGALVDLGTLAERVVKRTADCERAADACLALARAALDDGHAPCTDLAPIYDLARTQGHWSRRVEALGMLSDLAALGVGKDAQERIATVARALTNRTEHRWVQPAALHALASVDSAGALAIARDRLASPERGDDFLVRERIVELAARGVFGPMGFSSIVNLAFGDPSDHVRITLARSERDTVRLERMATVDASPKVRAMALISIAKHDAVAAESILATALQTEKSELVVRIAAEEIGALARRDGICDRDTVCAGLVRATERQEIAASVRNRAADALAEISVFCDPISRAAFEILSPVVAETTVGAKAIVHDQLLAGLDDGRLGRVLSVLAQDDFALGVDRTKDGLILHRGERRQFTGWRALHELTHPAPSKRQAFDHTLGRTPAGALRAPPGGLAELTATRVPGERVLSERAGGWGRHLPLVDDLLSTGVFKVKPVALVGSTGTTTLTPAKSLGARMKGWLSLTTRYAEYSELRRRALDAEEASTQVAYVNEIAKSTGITVQYTPHTFNMGDVRIAPVSPAGLSTRAQKYAPGVNALAQKDEAKPMVLPALAPLGALGTNVDWSGARDVWSDLVTYAQSPHGNRLPHLAAYVAVVLGAFLVRGVAVRRAIDHDRDALSLVIGGWGTRGKSGTERLKAALFQGLGHECLVKTTGCEAMFIHAVPGQIAREIFIYRPYDKATVWEQRDVLALARALKVRVFLYECMALQPDLVNLIQSQWMEDDYSTITNAYLDHEDVQGPSGYDVATVISEFVPTNGNLITSEEQMLPLLRERAKERGSTIRVVKSRDGDLIADDMLARFPYNEHPQNIALVTSLARALGISQTVALAEMADHVVPDLGVLKDYQPVPHLGRELSFVNGMSANERTAALGNWLRMGFDDHDPDASPKDWIVTVVNNRADRVARSEVFARFLVEDIAAHRHVLIGTNVTALKNFIDDALTKHLASISPTYELSGDGTERLQMARMRVDRAFSRLKVGSLDAASVLKEMEALSGPALDTSTVEKLLEPASPDEHYEAAKRAVETSLATSIDKELRPFLVESIARRRAVRAVHLLVGRDLGAKPTSVDAAFARSYRAMFDETVIPLDDSQLTGDQILDVVAKNVPPGARARIMGCQNIKGTGLDFVYRWVSIDTVHKYLALLESPIREKREEALRSLAMHGDYGLMDAKLALTRVELVQKSDPHANVLPYDVALARLREVVDKRSKRLATTRGKTLSESIRGVIGSTFDYLDSTRRRRMATELLEALVTGRVSHAGAAKKMREIVARTKGAWMQVQGA